MKTDKNLGEFIAYSRREFCKDLPCQVQILLDQEQEGSEKYEQIRMICKTACIHTTHEFHAWLIQKGYLILRSKQNDP